MPVSKTQARASDILPRARVAGPLRGGARAPEGPPSVALARDGGSQGHPRRRRRPLEGPGVLDRFQGAAEDRFDC